MEKKDTEYRQIEPVLGLNERLLSAFQREEQGELKLLVASNFQKVFLSHM